MKKSHGLKINSDQLNLPKLALIPLISIMFAKSWLISSQFIGRGCKLEFHPVCFDCSNFSVQTLS